MLKTLAISLVRTMVPSIVAIIVGFLAKANIHIDAALLENVVALALTTVVTGIFYVGVRLLERFKSPKWGWLLGYPSEPVYPEAVSAAELEADFRD